MDSVDRRVPEDQKYIDASDHIPPPVGTLFVMTVYLAILIGMWGVMYLELLRR